MKPLNFYDNVRSQYQRRALELGASEDAATTLAADMCLDRDLVEIANTFGDDDAYDTSVVAMYRAAERIRRGDVTNVLSEEEVKQLKEVIRGRK